MKHSHLFVILTLSLSLVLGNTFGYAQARTFDDVARHHNNYDAIEFVISGDIAKGYSDGSFQPDRLINRAEFTKIVIGAEYTMDQINACNKSVYWFNDVPQHEWYAPYVCVAKQNAIIKGYAGENFKPTQNITFVEAAKIITLALGIPDLTKDDPIWYRPYVTGLGDRKAIPLSINNLNQNITRGEMSEFIYRIKDRVLDKTTKTYDDFL